MSFVFVGVAKPWENFATDPVLETALAIVFGGFLLMFSITLTIYIFIYHRKDLDYIKENWGDE